MSPNDPLLAHAPREIIEISDDDVLEIPRPRGFMNLTPRPTPPARADEAFDQEWAALLAAMDGGGAGDDVTAMPMQEPVAAEPRPITEDECLARVVEIYPDISHDHVRHMFRGGLDVGMLADSTWCDQLIVRILDEGNYPTEREAKRAALKRKREPSEEDFERAPVDSGHHAARRAYQSAAINALQNHFREIPVTFIQRTFRDQGSSYKAFLRLDEADRTYSATLPSTRLFRKVRIRELKILQPSPSQEPHATEAMDAVLRETKAARKRVEREAAKRQQEELKRLDEERNAAQARSMGEESECMACFDTGPTNRMLFCSGKEPDKNTDRKKIDRRTGKETHCLCQDCTLNCVNAELDQGRCRPKCYAAGCEAEYSSAQLKPFLDSKVFARLEKLQQQDDLRKAGIENLEQCPFCDFQAECEPVEVDREFHCQNEDCRIVSCRLCRLETHTPLTCDEAAKERKGNIRHQIEEAMTKALVRHCNQCKAPFMKSDGCNKMSCGICQNVQCYVCGESVKGYDHFHNSHGKCPLYDENVEKRHVDEVKAAEARALEEVKKANPDMTDEELKVKLSYRVQQAEKKRVEDAQRRHAPHNHYHRHPVVQFPLYPPPGPIAIPGAEARNIPLPPDPINEPMMGVPLRWRRIDLPAHNLAPNHRPMNNPPPQQADIDAAAANAHRLNFYNAPFDNAHGVPNGPFPRFPQLNALWPRGVFGFGPAPVDPRAQQPNDRQPRADADHRAQQPQHNGQHDPGRERNVPGRPAQQYGNAAMFGLRGAQERQREHPVPDPDYEWRRREHEENLAALVEEQDRMRRQGNWYF